MKDYKNMTQEELEKELAEIVKKNYEKGVVILNRNYDICTLRLKKLSDLKDVEDIDSITAIIRSMKYKPDLKQYCKGMNDKTPLIHPIVDENAWKEQNYDDFVSREEFINRTGIFVSSSHFAYIHDVEWKEAKESGITVDDFVDDFEENNCEEVMEVPLHGTFKYLVMDDYLNCFADYNFDEGCAYSGYEPNLWEIINNLAREIAQEEKERDNLVKLIKLSLKSPIKNLVVTHSPSIETDYLLSGDMDRYYFDDAAKVELSDNNKELILAEENTNESLKFDVSKINSNSRV